MKQLVIFPRGMLAVKDKERMSREGYLAIEAEDPSMVVLPLPSGAITGDAGPLIALESMSGPASATERSIFAIKFTQLLRDRKVAISNTKIPVAVVQEAI